MMNEHRVKKGSKRAWAAVALAVVLLLGVAFQLFYVSGKGVDDTFIMVTAQPNNGEFPSLIYSSVTPFAAQHPMRQPDEELRAVWVAYPNLKDLGVTRESLDKIIATSKAAGMNAIMFHVRPFGDALYKSSIFPWSHFITGTQGAAPADGFDPLAYITERAHAAGIEVHAWINPLRIQSQSGTLPPALSANNPYNQYRGDHNPANDHYVIDYSGGKYYNPGEADVRALIAAGVKEIVDQYDVDGIHFDDYFYPAADGTFDDSISYQKYLTAGGTMNLLQWRQNNINELVRSCYNAVHEGGRENVVFGISPAGNINNCLYAGADVYTWGANPGYVDYICPQIYWTFDDPRAPFAPTLDKWRGLVTAEGVKLYVGLALYKAGSTVDDGRWQLASHIIQAELIYARSDKVRADGFMLYSYGFLDNDQTRTEMVNLMAILD